MLKYFMSSKKVQMIWNTKLYFKSTYRFKMVYITTKGKRCQKRATLVFNNFKMMIKMKIFTVKNAKLKLTANRPYK